MGDLLPILTGLIVVSALAVAVSNNDKKDDKKDKKEDKKEDKKDKKDDKKEIGKLIKEYLGKKSSSKKKHRGYRVIRNKYGKSYRDSRGKRLGRITSGSDSSSRKNKRS